MGMRDGEGEKEKGRKEGGMQRQAFSCLSCCISYAIQFVFQRENQFLMTILCAVMKGGEFRGPGKVAVGDGR